MLAKQAPDLDRLARAIADAIIAHATLGGLRPAAESLGISHQKLAGALNASA